MHRVSPIAILLLLLAFDARGEGIKLQDVPAKCPVCKTEFVAFVVVERGLSGGMDPDFFLRSIGEPAEDYGVWMCPHCFFCATPADYERELPESQRKQLLEMLPDWKKARPESMTENPESQRKIPAWFKWKVALACYELRKATLENPEAYLGDICLRGSWVTRVSGNPIERSKRVAATYQGVMEEFKKRNQAALGQQVESTENKKVALYLWYRSLGDLMAKDLGVANTFLPAERIIAQLMAGAFYRESGDLIRARVFLDEVLKGKSIEQEEERKIAARELELLELERQFQIQAVEHYRKAYDSGSIKDKELQEQCRLLIVELDRRLGKS